MTSDFSSYRWDQLEQRGVFGPSLGALYDTIPDIAESPIDFVVHKEAFLYSLEKLMSEGRLLVDLRFEAKSPPWGTVQREIIDWYRAHLPSEEVLRDGIWWIDNFSRPDGWYPGACVWHAAARDGSDIWA
jgi:hypothetical protein